MYYRLYDDGSVMDFSEGQYAEDCLYTDLEIVKSYNGNKFYVKGTEPEPTSEEIATRTQDHLTDVVQKVLDNEAQKLNYDSCLSVCSYVDTGVQKFDDESRAFRNWRSEVWAKGYEILNEILAGTREIPTEEELPAELPKLKIVYTK